MLRFRQWLARRVASLAIKLIALDPKSQEEFNMKVFDELAAHAAAIDAINARLDALPAPTTVDTSTFATTDALNAVAADIATIRGELGTPPADPSA